MGFVEAVKYYKSLFCRSKRFLLTCFVLSSILLGMPISTNWNSTQKIPHTFFTHFNWTTVIFDFPGKLTYHGELLKLEMSGESSATSEAAAQFATVAFRTASSVPQLLNYTLLERDTFDETACWPMQTSMWTVICWINQSHLLANKEGVGDKYHAVLRNFHDGTSRSDIAFGYF